MQEENLAQHLGFKSDCNFGKVLRCSHRAASVSAMHCLQRDTKPLAVRVLRWKLLASLSCLHFVQTCAAHAVRVDWA